MEATTINITVNLKEGETALNLGVSSDSTVEAVIDQISAAKPELDKSKISLVRKGRILKGNKVLDKIGVVEGDTLNLLIKEEKKEEPAAAPEGMPGMAGGLPPFMGMPGMPGMGAIPGMPGMGLPGMPPIPGMPGMPGMGAPGADGEGMSEMPEGFDPSQAAGMFNPEMMANILDNPMVKGMITDFLSDPEKIQNILSANPILGQMAEGNPEIQDLINNPDKIKEHMSDDKLNEALQGVKDNLKNIPPEQMTAPLGGGAPMGAPGAAPAEGAATTATEGGAAPGFGGMMGNMMGGIDQKTLNEMMAGFNIAPNPEPTPSAPADEYAGKSDEELQELFATQLETMSSMGFTDVATNIKTLKETGGNADLALQKLMGM